MKQSFKDDKMYCSQNRALRCRTYILYLIVKRMSQHICYYNCQGNYWVNFKIRRKSNF